MNFDKDAFSSGQIGSKIWLCEQAEILFNRIDRIWIYGGWYGMTNFLLRSRGNIKIQSVRSFDIDPRCEVLADTLNEHWVWDNWQFKAMTADCDDLLPTLDQTDMIINTSTEHFTSLAWFDNIPNGMTVILQGADMDHSDHVFKFSCLNNFLDTFSLTTKYFSGEKEFVYPDWRFKRFMVIGTK